MEAEEAEVERALIQLAKGIADGTRSIIVEPTKPGASILAGFTIRFSPPAP